MVTRSPNALNDVLLLCAVVVALVLANYVGGFWFFRLDLTTEQRYTLTKPTEQLLDGLNDVVYVKVYLDGDLPAGFRKLRDRTRETLDEFRARGNGQIEYEFIDPSARPDERSRNELYKQLAEKGVMPTNIQVRKDDGVEQKLIFPGAVLSHNGKEIPVQLLKSQIGASPEQMLNASLEDIEYELTNAIRKAAMDRTDKVAFIEGHRELPAALVADVAQALNEYYLVERVRISEQLVSLMERSETDSGVIVLPKYKAIIIAKPDSTFSEKDKFVIDQYIMYGGRVLWLIEPVFCNMDSLQYSPSTLAMPYSANLEDMLFRYGVRVNTDVVQDLNCASIPGPAGYVGSQLQWALQPWIFFPVAIPESNHPVVKNLNGIRMEFAASLDTVRADDVRKTILLHTGKHSRVLPTPAKVSLDVMLKEPSERQMNRSAIPLSVLLEGRFESVFKNRIAPGLLNAKEVAYRDKGRQTKMIVVSDGDIIRNGYTPDGNLLPAGYDRYSGQQYANGRFIINAVNFLLDDAALTEARSRSLEIRLLDRKKAKEERLKWQAFNIAGPIIAMVLFGIAWAMVRKRRYAS